MWDRHVGSQFEGPGEAQQRGAKAPIQWIWKRAVGHVRMPVQQLLAITIQVVVVRISLHKAGIVEPLTPVLL